MSVQLGRIFFILIIYLLTQTGCSRGGGGKDTDADANINPRDLPLEPLPTHPQVELSNLRLSRGPTGQERFSVDWKVTKKSEVMSPENTLRVFNMTLIVKPSNGQPMDRPMDEDRRKPGTGRVSAELSAPQLTGQKKTSLEEGCEMYVVIQDHRGKHKISNSITSGNARVTPTRPNTP